VSGFVARKDSTERPRTPEVIRGDSGDGEEEERDPSFMTVSSPSSPEDEERASAEWVPKDKRLLTGRKQYPKRGKLQDPSSSGKKETRGRPATTGDYVGLAAAKERLNAAKREELLLQDMERILDPASGPILTAVGRKNLPPRGVFSASLKGITSLELRKLAGTFCSQVERVAGASGMDEVLSRELLVSSMKLGGIAEEFAARVGAAADPQVDALRSENQGLRGRITSLERELERVSRELAALRAALPSIEAQLFEKPGKKRPRLVSPEGSPSVGAAGAPAVVGAGDRPVSLVEVTSLLDQRLADLRGDMVFIVSATLRSLPEEGAGASPSGGVSQSGFLSSGVGARAAGRVAVPASGGSAAPASAGVLADAPGPGAVTRIASSGTRRSRPKKAQKKKRSTSTQDGSKSVVSAPSVAMVSLTIDKKKGGADRTYASVLNEAKSRINLPDLGIEQLRMRRGATGSLLLSVSGRQAVEKAKVLADSLSRTFSATEEVRVGRPMRKGEVRLRGLMSLTSRDEILSEVVSVGSCKLEDLRAGPIRSSSGSGVGTMWLRCPDRVARGLVRAGGLKVGWMTLSVTSLGGCPLQCYRCLAFGHVSARCGSETDRKSCCYRCGKEGHRAADCTVSPHCMPCADKGKPADHRAGSKACARPFVPPKKTMGDREDNPTKRRQVPGRPDGGSTPGSSVAKGESSSGGVRAASEDAGELPPASQGSTEPMSSSP